MRTARSIRSSPVLDLRQAADEPVVAVGEEFLRVRSLLLNSSASATPIWKSSPGLANGRGQRPRPGSSSGLEPFSSRVGSAGRAAGSVVASHSEAASCSGVSGRTAATANRRGSGASPACPDGSRGRRPGSAPGRGSAGAGRSRARPVSRASQASSSGWLGGFSECIWSSGITSPGPKKRCQRRLTIDRAKKSRSPGSQGDLDQLAPGR